MDQEILTRSLRHGREEKQPFAHLRAADGVSPLDGLALEHAGELPPKSSQGLNGLMGSNERLIEGARSPWLQGAILTIMVVGVVALILLTAKIFHEAPPIPEQVTAPDGTVLFTGNDIRNGQQVFLKYGLLDKKSLWAGKASDASMPPELQQTLARQGAMSIAQQRYGQPLDKLTPAQRALIEVEVRTELKRNWYNPKTRVLAVGTAYGDWYKNQPKVWKERLSNSKKSGEKSAQTVRDPAELKQLSAFVAWSEWAADTHRSDPRSIDKKLSPVPQAGNATAFVRCCETH